MYTKLREPQGQPSPGKLLPACASERTNDWYWALGFLPVVQRPFRLLGNLLFGDFIYAPGLSGLAARGPREHSVALDARGLR